MLIRMSECAVDERGCYDFKFVEEQMEDVYVESDDILFGLSEVSEFNNNRFSRAS